MVRSRPWKVLATDYPVASPQFRLRREIVRAPGEAHDREYFIHESAGWVCVFCVTGAQTVVLNRQYKHGIRRYVLELPAGTLERGEDPLACAERELREETGYVADRFEYLGAFIIDPSGSEGIMHLFFCKGARRVGRKKRDPAEVIINRLVRVPTLLKLLRDRRINVVGHVAAIYTVLVANGWLDLPTKPPAAGRLGRRRRSISEPNDDHDQRDTPAARRPRRR